MSELRYHPYLDQWVITATHRQDRTFLPPADYNPLAPTLPGGFPTEVPFPEYDIVVFENKFPSLSPNPPAPAVAGTALCPVRSASGVCEVVCYSQLLDSTFATLPFSQIRKLARVWRERFVDLAAREDVKYVYIFENKGREIGVTLFHPHGQIYAYPFIPPTAQVEVQQESQHWAQHGTPLMAAVLAESSGQIVAENDTACAFVPFFARYPYEVYVTPKVHRPDLGTLSDAELDDFAEMMHVVTQKYDALFGFSMPYIMAMHQRPAKSDLPGAWLHAEFYPPYRTAQKLKYLAGSEAGAGAFINDTLAEVTAETLRALPPYRSR
ncbi:MAG: galactose-1-phosphate uridylyltransferase [Fimbriimonadaceae bacterium]|nr:galactose-1-phosphate uridylyltransferase [Fimbriimonadaceae bacterium]